MIGCVKARATSFSRLRSRDDDDGGDDDDDDDDDGEVDDDDEVPCCPPMTLSLISLYTKSSASS